MKKLTDSYQKTLNAPVPEYIAKGNDKNKYREWQLRYKKNPITEDSFGYIPGGKNKA